jgi:hypothetical protein
MRGLPILTGLLLLAVSGHAAKNGDSSAKPAWQWTEEERIAARFDENARAARVEAAMTSRRAATSSRQLHLTADSPASEHTFDVIVGSEHPELFMPFEVFGIFTRTAYGKSDAVAVNVRTDATAKAVALGLPDDFLDTLERESRPFLNLQRREMVLRTVPILTGKDLQALQPKLNEIELLECGPRADAIRRLRAIYGGRFDQFLYAVAARNITKEVSVPDNPSDLRLKEAGCR